MPPQVPNWLATDQQIIWRDWLAAVRVINDQLHSDLRPHGIDLNEYEVLVVLSEAEGRQMRMSSLACAANQSRSRLTHTISRMEKSGLVTRQVATDDKRGVIAKLSDKGFALLERVAPEHVASVRRVFVDAVDPDDYAALGRAMRSVLKVANSICEHRKFPD